MKIALIGNQNSGKTTLFNRLTGMNQKVGNWPGVTVEKREGVLNGSKHIITDLPGIYSLSPYTIEEKISRDFLLKEKLDLIINVIDSTNLERSLYLTTQLLELDCKIILVLNMVDVAAKKGIYIDEEKLGVKLGAKACKVSAKTGLGMKNLLDTINENVLKKDIKIFNETIEGKIYKIVNEKSVSRFVAIKMLEGDLESSNISKTVEQIENSYGMKMDEIIATQRYEFLDNVVENVTVLKKKRNIVNFNLDNIFLNKYVSFPIFVIVIFVIYYLSVGVVGKFATDFLAEKIFFIGEKLSAFLLSTNTSEMLVDLLRNGIICGVGTVLSFVPQLIVLFFCISFLEATGYMSRVAFMLDGLFRKIGLSGKSLIPFIVGLGCSVPGIMASRIIEKETHREKTIALTPFVPCSAKLPVIALFSGQFFPSCAEFVSVSFYFLSILIVCISAYIMGRFRQKYEDFVYISELPGYKLPNVKYMIRELIEKVGSFLKRTGSIILVCSVLNWFLLSFSTELEYGTNVENSILANVGKKISWFFYPIVGENSWEAAVSTLQGVVAKEQVVSSMAVISSVASNGKNIESVFDDGNVFEFFTPQTAYAFVAFNLYTIPCMGAITTMRKELGSNKKMLSIIFFQISVAYIVAIVARCMLSILN